MLKLAGLFSCKNFAIDILRRPEFVEIIREYEISYVVVSWRKKIECQK